MPRNTFNSPNVTTDLSDDNYNINTISSIERTLRINAKDRERIRAKILYLCLHDKDYLKNLINYNWVAILNLIDIFPNQRKLLLKTILKHTDFVDNMPSYSFENHNKANQTLLSLLSVFPYDRNLILKSVLCNETWLQNTIKGSLSIWRLKKLTEQFPEFEKNICDTVLVSNKIESAILSSLQNLQAHTSSAHLPTKAFLKEFLQSPVDTYLNTLDIKSDEDLLAYMKLFPKYADLLFDRAVSNVSFLESIKVDYNRIDTIEEMMDYLPKMQKSSIFEKLFSHPNIFSNLVTETCCDNTRNFKFRPFSRLLSNFPNCSKRMFELLFAKDNAKLEIGILSDLLFLINTYPNAKHFFYDNYLAPQKAFKDYIINTEQLAKLMKLFPEHELTLLQRAFTNETFISWRGFRTGYTSFESHYQNYIATRLHENQALQDYIFNKVFGTEELMSKLCSGKTPRDVIDDLDLLVKYFPNYSERIFKLAFPNPAVLEKRLINYDEYAPKLAKVFPKVHGLIEGTVFNANNEITFDKDDKESAKHTNVSKNLFSYFHHKVNRFISTCKDKVSDKLGDEIVHVHDMFSYRK